MKVYRLYIKTSTELPDHEDSCTANSKQEAAQKFLENPALKCGGGWTIEMLLPHISEEGEEDSLNIQYGNDIE